MWALSSPRPSDQFVGLNRLMNEAFSPWPFRVDNGGMPFPGMLPVVDVTEDQDGVRIVAEIPGYKPENVKVTIENRVLTMSGEKANGSFQRAFNIPTTVDAERIEASIEHGVLTVTLPRAEQAKPREILVKTV